MEAVQTAVVKDTVAILRLPTEVRIQIYRHLYTNQSVRANAFHYPMSEKLNDGPSGSISLQPQSRLIDLLLTCHTFHDEAIITFYSLINFRFEGQDSCEIHWSLTEVKASFPAYKSLTTSADLRSTRELVTSVSYQGNDANFIRQIGDIFPRLEHLDFDLSWDHLNADEPDFDQVMKYALANRDWGDAVKDALEQRFPDGMVHAVWDLQKTSKAQRGFQVLLHWRLAYRFVEFEGECDLDAWILHVRDPGGQSKNVYHIRQDPLFFEMG